MKTGSLIDVYRAQLQWTDGPDEFEFTVPAGHSPESVLEGVYGFPNEDGKVVGTPERLLSGVLTTD